MTRDNVKSKASQVLAAQVRTASRIPSIMINTVSWSKRGSQRCLVFTDGLCCMSAGEEEEAAETGARQMSGISSCRGGNGNPSTSQLLCPLMGFVFHQSLDFDTDAS